MVRAASARVCVLQLYVVKVDASFAACAEDTEGSREVRRGVGGGFEEGTEVGDEAHSRVVVQGKLAVDAFWRLYLWRLVHIRVAT